MPACPGCGVDNPERARFCLDCGRSLATGPSEARGSRRTVTVLFSDIVGSTALGELLDPEAVHIVMSSYFAEMQAVIEHHGGTVEKFIGDAIMAVFGLPVLHEDDALRAVRAAVGMREALAELNLRLETERGVTIAVRTGLNTGEVLAGDASARQTLVTGDAVNTAARLEQAAAAGEILLGATTWRLVRDAVSVEPVAALPMKGKADPVPAFLLRSVGIGGVRPDRADGPLIGRDTELDRLRQRFQAVVDRRRPAVVTVIGQAGVGKSRLVAEFVAGLGDRAAVLKGRCLSYGDGITYWPVREVLLAAAGIRDDDPPGEGLRKLELLVHDDPDGTIVAARLATTIGLSDDPYPQDELFWAVRRTLVDLASVRPLVLILEDLQWAEPTLLELIEHVLRHADGVPLMLVCPARPELLEIAADWLADRSEAATIVLDGLSMEAMIELLGSLPGGHGVPAGLRHRILDTAEGNPLFVEEVVRMLVDDGLIGAGTAAQSDEQALDEIRIPPTVQALMAARLDRLPVSERSTAQRASVVGRVFEGAAVEALTPDDARPELPEDLRALVLKQLVTPERAGLTEDDAFKFRHVLARDAAYAALAKTDRAILHERFADWLGSVAGDRAMEYQEILAYHLAEAYRYRWELREPAGRTDPIGWRAWAYLHAAGRRARDRGDAAAAVRLYARAQTLPAPDPAARADLGLDLGLALFDVGRFADARTQTEAALALAEDGGERRLAARARLLRLDLGRASGDLVTTDPIIRSELERALGEAEASGDPQALAEAWQSLSIHEWNEGRIEESEAHGRTALEVARDGADRRLALEIELNLLVTRFAGPLPAADFVTLAEEFIGRVESYPTVRAECRELQAVSEAMAGRSDAARRHAWSGVTTLADLGNVGALVNGRTFVAWVERLAGDLPAAEAVLRVALDEAQAVGDRSLAGFVSCRLAEVLMAQGRLAEAAVPLAAAERDPIGATGSRIAGMRARMKAVTGDRTAADDVDALIGLVAAWPWLNVRAEAMVDAAETMLALSDRAAAERHAREAHRLCVAKGNVAMAGHVEALLARIAGVAP